MFINDVLIYLFTFHISTLLLQKGHTDSVSKKYNLFGYEEYFDWLNFNHVTTHEHLSFFLNNKIVKNVKIFLNKF